MLDTKLKKGELLFAGTLTTSITKLPVSVSSPSETWTKTSQSPESAKPGLACTEPVAVPRPGLLVKTETNDGPLALEKDSGSPSESVALSCWVTNPPSFTV